MSGEETIRLHFTGSPEDVDNLLSREWIVTNGLGGYASGTLSGIPTRRYHSLLTASLPAPSWVKTDKEAPSTTAAQTIS